jgi:excisionase family DNA binding protein
MGSNIRVQRICQYCGKEFTARTTVTKYCGDTCAKKAYKQGLRQAKIEQSDIETSYLRNREMEDLKKKEILNVREVAKLLDCSVRSVYYYIENGSINAINLGQRITRVRRVDIDRLFETNPQIPLQPQDSQLNQPAIAECYTIAEVREKFCVSEKALYSIIKRNNIPKIKKGWHVYLPKTLIDNIFSYTETL